MFEGCDGLLPSRLLNIQLRCGLIFITKGAEISGSGCFDDRGKASLQGRFGRGPAKAASIAWTRGLAAMRAPRCAGAAMYRALLYPIPDWSALNVACVILSSVRPGKSRSRPMPNLVVDFCSALFLKDCVGRQIPSAGPGKAKRFRAQLE